MIKLNELTEKDFKKLLENDTVSEKVMDMVGEASTDYVDDVLSSIKGLGNYDVGDSSNRDNILPVDNSWEFLCSMKDMNDDYGLLNDKDMQCIDNTINNGSEDDNEEVASHISRKLLNDFIQVYDSMYDTGYCLDILKDNIVDMYPDNAWYSRDTNKIYYTMDVVD